MNIKTRLAEHNLKVIQAQVKYDEAYADLQELKKEGREIYKHITEVIRDSNGKLTLDKLIEGVN